MSERQQWLILAHIRAEFNASLESCRAHLTAAKFQAAWEQGQMLSMEQVIEYARAILR